MFGCWIRKLLPQFLSCEFTVFKNLTVKNVKKGKYEQEWVFQFLIAFKHILQHDWVAIVVNLISLEFSSNVESQRNPLESHVTKVNSKLCPQSCICLCIFFLIPSTKSLPTICLFINTLFWEQVLRSTGCSLTIQNWLSSTTRRSCFWGKKVSNLT